MQPRENRLNLLPACIVQVCMVAKNQIQTSVLSSLLVAPNKQKSEPRLTPKIEGTYFWHILTYIDS